MSNGDDPVLAVDIGNTRIKCGIVQNSSGTCIFDEYFPAQDLFSSLSGCLQKMAAAAGVTSTIPVVIAGTTSEMFSRLAQMAAALGFKSRHFQYRSSMPFSLAYENTPGADRLAQALYATVTSPGHDHIIISAGTAVTVDLIVNNTFSGGTIFPGISSQLKCLPAAAPALPLVSPDGPASLPGTSTETCIRSGVLTAIGGGIEKIIAAYRKIAPDALIHACGGDWPYLSLLVNETIMYNKYMTLTGIALSEKFI
ncbi:MAG TPA: type III pantothenate kinase [Chitinispirillaceae bacterium]|nr:type III pantothenate kinase [Chitinispirillaceae bacterium]